jgi:hypothetical protein
VIHVVYVDAHAVGNPRARELERQAEARRIHLHDRTRRVKRREVERRERVEPDDRVRLDRVTRRDEGDQELIAARREPDIGAVPLEDRRNDRVADRDFLPRAERVRDGARGTAVDRLRTRASHGRDGQGHEADEAAGPCTRAAHRCPSDVPVNGAGSKSASDHRASPPRVV